MIADDVRGRGAQGGAHVEQSARAVAPTVSALGAAAAAHSPQSLPRSVLAFDLEFADLVEDGDFRACGITCASTCMAICGCDANDASCTTQTYHGGLVTPEQHTSSSSTATLAPRMSAAQVRAFVDVLCEAAASGTAVATHGGTAADFRALSSAVDDAAYRVKVLELARGHVDIVLVCAAVRGYAMSLSSLCQGMGYAAKKDDASSSAPALWRSGLRDRQDEVLRTNAHDAWTTAQIFADLAWRGKDVRWVTTRKHVKTLALPRGDGCGMRGLASPPLRTATSASATAFECAAASAASAAADAATSGASSSPRTLCGGALSATPRLLAHMSPPSPMPLRLGDRAAHAATAASPAGARGHTAATRDAEPHVLSSFEHGLPTAVECARMSPPDTPFVPDERLSYKTMSAWLL